MNKENYEKYLQIANRLNDRYAVISDCYSQEGGIKNYDFFIFYDDDITSVLKGIRALALMVKTHGLCGPSGKRRKVVFVGGEGLLANAFKVMRIALLLRGKGKEFAALIPENEAQRLQRVALSLWVNPKDCILLDTGKNTTENLRLICDLVKDDTAIIAVTQRLALIFQQSVDFQCNQHPEKFGLSPLKIDLYVIKQTVEQTLRWYNFQIAGKGRVSFHFFAHLVKRFDNYDGKFLNKPFEPRVSLRKDSEVLSKKFLIKQRSNNPLKYFQYIPIIWDIFWNAEKYLDDEAMAIAEARADLKREFPWWPDWR